MGQGYHILKPAIGKNGYKTQKGLKNAAQPTHNPLKDTKLERLDKQQRQFAKGQQEAERQDNIK